MSAPVSDVAGIRQIIRALRAQGWVLNNVYDGEETVRVRTEMAAIDAINAVDEATLTVFDGRGDGGQGWVYFVLGNSPEEVVADHTINLSAVIGPVAKKWWR